MKMQSLRKFVSDYFLGGKLIDRQIKKSMKRMQSPLGGGSTAIPQRLWAAKQNYKEAPDPKMKSLFADMYDAELSLWEAQKALAKAKGISPMQLAIPHAKKFGMY